MIPKQITYDDIINAINVVRGEVVPVHRKSHKWDLEYKGEILPPKYIISIAAKLSTYNKEFGGHEFQATEARNFLVRRGFNIQPRNKYSAVAVIDDIPPDKTLSNVNLKMALSELNTKTFTATRIEKIIEQSIRNDTALIRQLKQLYDFKCQMPDCKAEIIKKDGSLYCEVAHITPFSEVQCSAAENLIVFCPNHHKEFDLGDVQIISRNNKLVKGKINGRYFEFKLKTI